MVYRREICESHSRQQEVCPFPCWPDGKTARWALYIITIFCRHGHMECCSWHTLFIKQKFCLNIWTKRRFQERDCKKKKTLKEREKRRRNGKKRKKEEKWRSNLKSRCPCRSSPCCLWRLQSWRSQNYFYKCCRYWPLLCRAVIWKNKKDEWIFKRWWWWWRKSKRSFVVIELKKQLTNASIGLDSSHSMYSAISIRFFSKAFTRGGFTTYSTLVTLTPVMPSQSLVRTDQYCVCWCWCWCVCVC